MLRLPAVALTVAGRTDAGVHATGQVAHFDLPDVPADLLRRLAGGAAARRPGACRASRCRPSSTPASPRCGAATTTASPTRAGAPTRCAARSVLAWPRPLDVAAMAAPPQQLLGLHDFAAFCRRARGRDDDPHAAASSTVRRAPATRSSCTVRADAFCHSMVRSLVGALLAVGEGRRPVEWPAALLDARPARGRRAGRARARADAGRGRLPARRRARRPRRAHPRPSARQRAFSYRRRNVAAQRRLGGHLGRADRVHASASTGEQPGRARSSSRYIAGSARFTPGW